VAVLSTAFRKPVGFARAAALMLKIGWRSDRGMLIHFVYLAEACILLRWIMESKVEHLHCHFGRNSTAVAMLCGALGGPSYSFTVHGPEEFDKVKAISLGEKIRRAAFVVAISSFCRGQLFRWCEIDDWKKIHVIRCGVDDAYLTPGARPLPAGRRFVCLGRLSEQKGQLLLLRAAGQLVAEGFDFEMVLVGDGPLRGEVDALIESEGLRDRVQVTGWASGPEVFEQLLASQVMVLPSFAEGLPVVLMEALALGRPVISTYIAGIPELIEDRKCGWLVPSGSQEDLMRAMREALEAPPERLQEMGRLGAERVARLHNVRAEADKLAALFEQHCTFRGSEAERSERGERVGMAHSTQR
jgi:glycosyltransferase involved in cell wall biosynthesis